jgi:hypothetical protein
MTDMRLFRLICPHDVCGSSPQRVAVATRNG